MAGVKAVFLLPFHDNDGRDLTAEIIEVQTQLWTMFTAFSKEGQVEGVYQMADGSRVVVSTRNIQSILMNRSSWNWKRY